MALPTFVGAGAFTVGTGSQTPPLPTGYAVGDDLFCVVSTNNAGTTTITTATGWTEVPGSPVNSTTTGTVAGSVRLAVFHKRAESLSETAPTIAGSSGARAAQIFAFRGAKNPPWSVTPTTSAAAASTSLSAPAIVTATIDNLVLHFVATDKPADDTSIITSGPTNSNLTGLTAHAQQSSATGTGVGLIVISGAKATAGNTGATTGTVDASEEMNYLTLALEGEAPVSGTGAVTIPMATATGTGTSTVPVFSGTGAVSIPMQTAAGSGVSTVPVFSGTGAVSIPKQTATGTATRTVPVFSGTGAVTIPMQTVAGTGLLTQTFLGSGAVTIPMQTVAGTAEWYIEHLGTGAVSIPMPLVAGQGITTVPVFAGVGAVSIPTLVAAGAGMVALPIPKEWVYPALPTEPWTQVGLPSSAWRNIDHSGS